MVECYPHTTNSEQKSGWVVVAQRLLRNSATFGKGATKYLVTLTKITQIRNICGTAFVGNKFDRADPYKYKSDPPIKPANSWGLAGPACPPGSLGPAMPLYRLLVIMHLCNLFL
eukprot:g32150.t1